MRLGESTFFQTAAQSLVGAVGIEIIPPVPIVVLRVGYVVITGGPTGGTEQLTLRRRAIPASTALVVEVSKVLTISAQLPLGSIVAFAVQNADGAAGGPGGLVAAAGQPVNLLTSGNPTGASTGALFIEYVTLPTAGVPQAWDSAKPNDTRIQLTYNDLTKDQA